MTDVTNEFYSFIFKPKFKKNDKFGYKVDWQLDTLYECHTHDFNKKNISFNFNDIFYN